MSKDGVVAMCHDKSFKRLTGVDILVDETNISEFPLYSDKSPLEIEFGG